MTAKDDYRNGREIDDKVTVKTGDRNARWVNEKVYSENTREIYYAVMT